MNDRVIAYHPDGDIAECQSCQQTIYEDDEYSCVYLAHLGFNEYLCSECLAALMKKTDSR